MNRLSLLFVFIMLVTCSVISATGQTDKKDLSSAVIYPKIRIWTTPSAGEEPSFNPPSLQWPAAKKAKYSIRLSSSRDFSNELIEREKIPYAIFNPHKSLHSGKWYWQYKMEGSEWNKADSFMISPAVPLFETPDFMTVLNAVPRTHPRVLVRNADIGALRLKAHDYKESKLIIHAASNLLSALLPAEKSLNPSFEGKNDFENEKIASITGKYVGMNIRKVLNTLSQAYILTGDLKYFNAAKKWMLSISEWDPKGPSHLNNFGDSGIMSGLAVGVDTFWDLLTGQEREKIMKNATIRAGQFYNQWAGQVESRSSSMHVWQYILHFMLQTSVAFIGENPDAGRWMEYVYELWIAQCPKMGESDGAWFNGTGYFSMNELTLFDVNDIFKDLTGKDFMQNEWYRNSPFWLIYAYPPNSVADGFCNDGNRYPKPTMIYAGYEDAAARKFNNPYASWYAGEIEKSWGTDIAGDEEFRWFRILNWNTTKLPDPVKNFDLPQAAVFRDVGVAYMHTNLQKSVNDLMFSIRSSPFGPMGHAHADQNTFNIAFGGKRLFYNTGYRPAMGDPHFLGWYKHTQGHNGILIDGKGQPFNDTAYGYLPRFLHGKQISYAVGDASHAWTGNDDAENKNPGLKVFRRHYLMLRPATIVIYDELEADHAAKWSWLIHNDKGLKIDPANKSILAENEAAKAMVSLYSSSPVDFQTTDQFAVPVENWTNKTDEEGDTIVFKNQWHFKATTIEKCPKMRYLAIIRVKPGGGFDQVASDKDGQFTAGEWKIRAELDANKAARIEIRKKDGSAAFCSDGILEINGKSYNGSDLRNAKLYEKIAGKQVFLEAGDEIPVAIQKALMKNAALNQNIGKHVQVN
jgi:hypothetical protein